ncbi:hypothetical protein BGZ90_003387 [Linnemannia elongata]|nr:hypothetical protein BGZ90_003387 [Linnemannia elongata]
MLWTLAMPLLDQLEGLSFPLSDISRWTGVVAWLERLESLEFVLDEIPPGGPFNNPINNSEASKLYKDEAMKALVHFSWKRLLAHPEMTDLGYVREVPTPHRPDAPLPLSESHYRPVVRQHVEVPVSGYKTYFIGATGEGYGVGAAGVAGVDISS